MSSKAGNWIIAAGALGIFAGLCSLPAAFAEHAEPYMIAVAGSLFSMGMLMVASGIYLKARALQEQSGPAANEPAAAPRKQRGNCDLCGGDVAVIHCKVHQLHMCSTCMAEHYDFRSCAFVPTTRRPSAKAGRTMAKARGV